MDNKLLIWNENYLAEILSWRNWKTTQVNKLVKIQGFDQFNSIVDINSVFSSAPRYMPVDRTGHTKLPFQYKISRPWQAPAQQWTLDYALEQRVKYLCSKGQKLNLLWSGGIDSTTLVTAFLKHAPDRQQLRIMYSPWSNYEHPGYLEFLKKFNDVELVDLSGVVYLSQEFDGLMVTGEGGDELTGSLDESFIELHGVDRLHTPWQDLFWESNPNEQFMEFCYDYFKVAGRPIETVLHARWWFYAACKVKSLLYDKLPWMFDQEKFDSEDLVGFFDCKEFENYIYWNIESSISGSEYCTWKQIFKDYCFEFDGFEEWHRIKTKFGSLQIICYTNKKIVLKNQQWLAILDDGTRISTPSLPVLTRKEFEQRHNLDHLFNQPD